MVLIICLNQLIELIHNMRYLFPLAIVGLVAYCIWHNKKKPKGSKHNLIRQ